MISLAERIKRVEKFHPSNCVGTALFLAGLQENDSYVDTLVFKRDFLPRLRRVFVPEFGCFVILTGFRIFPPSTEIVHMGVVSGLQENKSPYVANRMNANPEGSWFFPFEKIEHLDRMYRRLFGKVEYYSVKNS